MTEKAHDDAVKKQEQEPELSEAALQEVSGGGIIIEDLQGSTAQPAGEFYDAHLTEIKFPALDASSREAKQVSKKTT